VSSAQFEDQGGVAGMDPPAPLRWFASRFMTRMADRGARDARRARAERRRARAGAPHVIEYFHQVDDAYSYLAAQLLAPLAARYEVQIVPHLVRGPSGRNAPEPELLLDLAVRDAAAIAPHYGLDFPEGAVRPAAEAVAAAERLLAGAEPTSFAELAVAAGAALFGSNLSALSALAAEREAASSPDAERALDAGTRRRARLGHYSGAMFHYAGEWYWGADRLYHLEARLAALGARRQGVPPLVPRPAIEYGPRLDDGGITLEFFPSLRSPYTSLIFDATVELAERTGVRLVMRPVLPMVMRGVPATREKGRYIMFDASREAESLGLDWGRIYDPIGDPVRRAYSLYPWAVEQGRGNALLSAFLHAAFFDGISTNREAGMRQVVEAAGLDWSDARGRIGDPAWEVMAEDNRQAMYRFGCWGVPSYRLIDRDGAERLALWGQDRLWLVAREIQHCLGA